MFKKFLIWIGIVLVLVAVVFAQQVYQSLIVMPANDGAYVFLVQGADAGTIVFRVDTESGVVAVGGNLTVSGTSTTTGNTTVTGNLAVTGTSALTGAVTLSGALSGTINLDTTVCNSGAFTGTETLDTVLISGALGTDKYILSPGIAKGGTIDAEDTQLAYSARADTLIVVRPANGLTALTYSWLRIR